MNKGDIQTELEGIVPWASLWEPRLKLIASSLYIFGIISLMQVWSVMFALCITIFGALHMGLKLSFILRRFLIIAPFLLLMTLPLVFGDGFPVDSERVAFASVIMLKALTCMIVIIVILHTQTIQSFFSSLAHLRLPHALVSILFLTHRYIYIFFDDIQKMQTALQGRHFKAGISIKSLNAYGQLTGGLFIKSINRAEKVHHAMVSRGFEGRLFFNKAKKIVPSDYFKSALILVIVALILVFDKM